MARWRKYPEHSKSQLWVLDEEQAVDVRRNVPRAPSVYPDSGLDENILGVFDNAEDAEEYQESIKGDYALGAMLSSFPSRGGPRIVPPHIDIG